MYRVFQIRSSHRKTVHNLKWVKNVFKCFHHQIQKYLVRKLFVFSVYIQGDLLKICMRVPDIKTKKV